MALLSPVCHRCVYRSIIMDAGKEERPRTLWFGKEASSNPITVSSGPINYASSGPLAASSTVQAQGKQNDYSHSSRICQIVDQDPWTIYEARADVCYGRDVTLARHHKCQLEIVHIQHLHPMELSSAHTLMKTIN